MKKILLFILIFMSVITGLKAQETKKNSKNELNSPKNIIKLLPLGVVFDNQIGIGYERVIKPKRSLNFLLLQEFSNGRLDAGGVFKSYAVLLETEYRFYLSKEKNAPKGWFISGGLLGSYSFIKITDLPQTADITSDIFEVGASTRSGYNWLFGKNSKGFSVGIVGGIDFRTTLNNLSNNNINLAAYISIGYFW